MKQLYATIRQQLEQRPRQELGILLVCAGALLAAFGLGCLARLALP